MACIPCKKRQEEFAKQIQMAKKINSQPLQVLKSIAPLPISEMPKNLSPREQRSWLRQQRILARDIRIKKRLILQQRREKK